MSTVVLTSDNFQKEVLDSGMPVLIDFWAPWCGPCRALTPVVEELGQELAGKVKVGKVNVDEQRELAAKFGIMSIPTLMVFRDGKVSGTSLGLKPKEMILKMLED